MLKNKNETDSRIIRVGFISNKKRGKRTVINQLLGEKILPADVFPTIAIPTYIKYGSKPKAILEYKNGENIIVPIDLLADYMTMIDLKSSALAEHA